MYSRVYVEVKYCGNGFNCSRVALLIRHSRWRPPPSWFLKQSQIRQDCLIVCNDTYSCQIRRQSAQRFNMKSTFWNSGSVMYDIHIVIDRPLDKGNSIEPGLRTQRVTRGLPESNYRIRPKLTSRFDWDRALLNWSSVIFLNYKQRWLSDAARVSRYWALRIYEYYSNLFKHRDCYNCASIQQWQPMNPRENTFIFTQ